MVPAVLAGLAIGMVQSELTYLKGQYTGCRPSGLAELVPLLLILLVLVARATPAAEPGRDHPADLGRAPRPERSS